MNRGRSADGALALLGGVVLGLGVLASCSPGGAAPTPSSGRPDTHRTGASGVQVPRADGDFARQVLADGTVSREELDQGISRFLQCLTQGGATGTYWVQPDLGRTSPALNLSTPDGVNPDLLIGTCSDGYLGAVERTYALAHPPTAAQEARMVQLATACLDSRSPTLRAAMPPGSDYRALRSWAAQTDQSGADAKILDECVVRLGIADQPLGS